jgi:hypothetical protein
VYINKRGADKSLARPGRKQAIETCVRKTENFCKFTVTYAFTTVLWVREEREETQERERRGDRKRREERDERGEETERGEREERGQRREGRGERGDRKRI